nr:unnamed protein product [Callosobruchus analis]
MEGIKAFVICALFIVMQELDKNRSSSKVLEKTSNIAVRSSYFRSQTRQRESVQIDYALKWNEQITTVISKMSSASYLIGSLRDQVSVHVLKMIYHGYVQSVMDYSIMFWFHSPKCSEVFTWQKKIIRIALKLSPSTSCREHFRNLKVLTVLCLYIFNIAVDTKLNLARSHNNLSVPTHKTKMFEKGPYYNCIQIFNALPNHIRDISNILTFKRTLKAYLIDRAFYTLEEYFNE